VIDGKEIQRILGGRIRGFRKQKQLSQADLAEKAGISITFLSSIERGNKYPASVTLSKIVNALDVSVSELFQTDNEVSYLKLYVSRFKKDLTRNMLKSIDAVYNEYDEYKK
jgi:transcriptional regulator with XRE-family HTH domain